MPEKSINTWAMLRFGQNTVDELLDEEYRLKRELAETEKRRKILDQQVNLEFDIAMQIARGQRS